ncbi:hypothetical protein [Desulfovibrio falkowii]|uniref:hypothetical protein n=1 Tax=Desulfovibrio sp. WGS1351 TaxID=3366814 RepID=UPI00372D0F68
MNIGSAAGQAGADRMRIKLFHARQYSSFDSCSQEEALFHIFSAAASCLRESGGSCFFVPNASLTCVGAGFICGRTCVPRIR